MKKSSFTALVLGMFSGMLFALGMCMALLPEWNALVPGVVLGCAGLVLGLVTVIVWRKMERKPPIRLSRQTVLVIVISAFGALLLGAGMCCCLVWDRMITGIILGMFGLAVPLSLIPLTRGLHD